MAVWDLVRNWWGRVKARRMSREDLAAGDLRYSGVSSSFEISQRLLDRYADYENMDDYPDCATALSVYADDATVMDQLTGETVKVEAEDETVRSRLEDLFRNRLAIDDHIWEIARQLAKYGTEFELLHVDEGGVQGIEYLPPAMTRRLEKGGSVVFLVSRDIGVLTTNDPAALEKEVEATEKGEAGAGRTGVYAGWRVAHFRLFGRRGVDTYGRSVLEQARWAWRRLVMLEDAAMVFRLTRAPSRFAFYVDVGRMSKAQAEAHLEKLRRRLKRRAVVDPDTGKLNYRYLAVAHNEDFFIPVRDGRETVRVDTVQTPMWSHMDDIEYFQRKLHAALGVPRAYLGYDEALRSRATLSQEDVRFARAVMRLQTALKAGLRHIAEVDLALAGIDPAYVRFRIKMPVASAVFELARLEVMQSRVGLARDYGEWFSRKWVLQNLFGLSDAEIAQVEEERVEDMKAQARAEMEAEAIRSGGEGGMGRRSRWEGFERPVPRERSFGHRSSDRSANEILAEARKERGRDEEVLPEIGQTIEDAVEAGGALAVSGLMRT